MSKPPDMPTQGNCDLCGAWSSQLMDGVCPGCVTRYQPKGAGQGGRPATVGLPVPLLADGRLTARDLRVLLAAQQHRDPALGVFHAGYRTLAKATNLRVTRVCEAVGRLERLGWVRKQRVGRLVHLTMEGGACGCSAISG